MHQRYTLREYLVNSDFVEVWNQQKEFWEFRTSYQKDIQKMGRSVLQLEILLHLGFRLQSPSSVIVFDIFVLPASTATQSCRDVQAETIRTYLEVIEQKIPNDSIPVRATALVSSL